MYPSLCILASPHNFASQARTSSRTTFAYFFGELILDFGSLPHTDFCAAFHVSHWGYRDWSLCVRFSQNPPFCMLTLIFSWSVSSAVFASGPQENDFSLFAVLLWATNTIVFLVLFVYDYVLTFDQEVAMIWSRKWTSSTIFFCLVRIITLCAITVGWWPVVRHIQLSVKLSWLCCFICQEYATHSALYWLWLTTSQLLCKNKYPHNTRNGSMCCICM